VRSGSRRRSPRPSLTCSNVFNTWLFAAFAVIVVAVYAVAPPRLRAYVLVLAGLAFYANAGPLNLLLIVAGDVRDVRLRATAAGYVDGSRRFVLAGAAVVALVLILCTSSTRAG